ncbi:hypothetical protein BOSP111201_15550 [Bordetella sputigena]|uniref:hypothetical protein n=1 Tax=Bordetella sputigena TaxID=1416810 RepID=UPI0039F117F3
MLPGQADGPSSTYVAPPVSAADRNVGVTESGHTFTAHSAPAPDNCGGAPHPRARATLARRDSWNLFAFGWRLRGQRVARSAVRHAVAGDTSLVSRQEDGSSTGSNDAAGTPSRMLRKDAYKDAYREPYKEPVSLRFVPLTGTAPLPSTVIPHARAAHAAMYTAVVRQDASGNPSAASWPRRLLSTVKYRIRYWTAPGEHRKALRMTYTREKVVGATYVFLNAMLSDEALGRHFRELQRQVRRLDGRLGVHPDISDESARVLRDAADRTAATRQQVRDRMLSLHREELLHGAVGMVEYRRADAILLALESRIVVAIALYGDALRCIAAIDVENDAVCDAIGGILETVFAREAEAGSVPRKEWLESAVDGLPHRALVRLHTVLSGHACGGAYQDFLDELMRIVDARMGTASPDPAVHAHATAGG